MKVRIKPSVIYSQISSKFFLRKDGEMNNSFCKGGSWTQESARKLNISDSFDFQDFEEAINLRLDYINKTYKVKMLECFYVGNICYIHYITNKIRIETLWVETDEG